MRKLAGVLLIIAVLPAAVLGGLYVLSSRYEAMQAVVKSKDLSAVAGDLASPEDLAKERAAATKRLEAIGEGRGGRQMGLAIALLVGALLQFCGGVLLLLGRRESLALVGAGISLAALLLAQALEGFVTLGGVAAVLVALGIALGVIARRRGPARPAVATDAAQ